MSDKEFLSAIAIVLTFAGFYPYIKGILTGTVKPHVFSWVIWSITTCVVFFAQIESHGGVGAWPIGVSGGITILIAILAYLKRADAAITKTDSVFFGLAIFSLPLWYVTADPMWTVVVLTVVDLLGFGPTLRKAYVDPYSESLLFFGLFAARDVIASVALAHYSVTTMLFPIAIAIACTLLMLLIVLRRMSLHRRLSKF